MNAYYTHQDTLNKILESFDYSTPIHCLEFGSGDGSSSVFHTFAQSNPNLTVDCFEHEESWLTSMSEKYKLNNYNFNVVDWSTMNYDDLKIKNYDLIFVDQGDWDARLVTIDKMKNNAKYIILHDYCYYNGFGPGMVHSPDMDFNNVGEGSFFHKYSVDFEVTGVTELFPPTLILKSKNL
jgi:hypothetical protein